MDGENSAQISSSHVLSSSFPEKINVQSFQPIQLLGKGSFGEVFLVQKKSGTNYSMYYAMKVLSKQRIMGHNLVRYAKTERNVLSYTRHPFIVNLNYAF